LALRVRARLGGVPRAMGARMLVVGIGSLVLAGCGGGSSAPTKAQYIAKVNPLCAGEQQQLGQAALEKVKIGVTLDHANTIRERSLGEIEAVKQPTNGAIAPEWLQLRKRALVLAKRIAALGLGSVAARPLDREYVVTSNAAERIATAYGLTSCRGFAGV
jgi:hypothetical protein